MSGLTGVPFQNIPADNITPLFFVEFNNQFAGVQGNEEQPTLLIGQMMSTGTAAANALVYVPSAPAAMNLFGVNSQLARMCATYFNSDPEGPLWALPLTDATGSAAATGTIAFSGSATAAGTISLYIGRQLIPVGVNIGDTAAVIAGNVVTAVNGMVQMPVNAAATAGTVTFTANNKGLQGNNIILSLNYLGSVAGQATPAGITAVVTAMANGATDPDLGGVAAILGDQIFDFIGHPYGELTQMGELTTMMNDTSGRWAWNRQDYGGVFTATPGTQSSLLTLSGSLNDQHNVDFGVLGYNADPADVVADAMGEIAVSIRNLPSLPVHGLKLNTVIGAPRASWPTIAQQNTLLGAGIALLNTDSLGNVTILEAVTTYKQNAFGQPDASYRYPTTLYTLMAITRTIKTAFVTKFGRCLLVPSGTATNPNVPAVSTQDLQSEIIAQYLIMESKGLVVNAAAMAAATIVQINAANPNRADVIWRPELANGLNMIAMVNQFILNPAQAA